jgi:hypothetical protein
MLTAVYKRNLMNSRKDTLGVKEPGRKTMDFQYFACIQDFRRNKQLSEERTS